MGLLDKASDAGNKGAEAPKKAKALQAEVGPLSFWRNMCFPASLLDRVA